MDDFARLRRVEMQRQKQSKKQRGRGAETRTVKGAPPKGGDNNLNQNGPGINCWKKSTAAAPTLDDHRRAKRDCNKNKPQ